MERFKSILVVFDRATAGREALDQAAKLAQRNGARLSLLVCLTEFERSGDSDNLENVVVNGLRSHFEGVIEPLRAMNLAVSSEVRLGRPFIQVIRHVLGDDHDLVIKVAESGGHHGFQFSSTDLHLLRKCPRPLWLLKPSHPGENGPILAAIAPSGGHRDIAALNAYILELASSLAIEREQPLHVVQAWAPIDPLLLNHLDRPGWDDPATTEKLDLARSRANALFDRTVRPFVTKGLDIHRHFVDGVPSRAIVDLVRDLVPDVAVMSTLNRASVAGLLVGETAEDVFRQIGCSVLALKPTGFVSPVAA